MQLQRFVYAVCWFTIISKPNVHSEYGLYRPRGVQAAIPTAAIPTNASEKAQLTQTKLQ